MRPRRRQRQLLAPWCAGRRLLFLVSAPSRQPQAALLTAALRTKASSARYLAYGWVVANSAACTPWTAPPVLRRNPALAQEFAHVCSRATPKTLREGTTSRCAKRL